MKWLAVARKWRLCVGKGAGAEVAGGAAGFGDGVVRRGEGGAPGWEAGGSAADQPCALATLRLSGLQLIRQGLTDGLHHLWLNQSESQNTGREEWGQLCSGKCPLPRGAVGELSSLAPVMCRCRVGILSPLSHGFPQSGSWGNGPSWRFRHLAEAQRLRGEGSLVPNSASHSFSTTCTKGVLLSGCLGEPGALSSSRSLRSPLQVSSQEIPEPGKEVRSPQRSPGESSSGSYRVSSIFSAGVFGWSQNGSGNPQKAGTGRQGHQ